MVHDLGNREFDGSVARAEQDIPCGYPLRRVQRLDFIDIPCDPSLAPGLAVKYDSCNHCGGAAARP